MPNRNWLRAKHQAMRARGHETVNGDREASALQHRVEPRTREPSKAELRVQADAALAAWNARKSANQ